MKTLLKYLLIALFCISTIKSECTGTSVTKSACEEDTSCKWTEGTPGSCGGTNNGAESPVACNTFTTQATCTGGTCAWVEATGACTEKCADYSTEDTCVAETTCQWADSKCSTKPSTNENNNNNNNNNNNGVFGLKSSILISIMLFLF